MTIPADAETLDTRPIQRKSSCGGTKQTRYWARRTFQASESICLQREGSFVREWVAEETS